MKLNRKGQGFVPTVIGIMCIAIISTSIYATISHAMQLQNYKEKNFQAIILTESELNKYKNISNLTLGENIKEIKVANNSYNIKSLVTSKENNRKEIIITTTFIHNKVTYTEKLSTERND